MRKWICSSREGVILLIRMGILFISLSLSLPLHLLTQNYGLTSAAAAVVVVIVVVAGISRGGPNSVVLKAVSS